MNPTPSLVRLGLRALTLGLPLWPSGSGLVEIPGRYLKVNWRGPYTSMTPFMEPLVRLIQLVLGSSVELDPRTGELVWGEGGVCNRCGALLPLHDFEDRRRAKDLHCSVCGSGSFGYCYPPEALKTKLRFELCPAAYHQPALFLMSGQVREWGEDLSLAAAAWGAVCNVLIIQTRLRTRVGSTNEGLRNLGNKLRFLGYPEPRRLLLVDEFLVHRQACAEFPFVLGPTVILARLLFEHALENGVTAVLVWTKPRWPYAPFWRALGFGEIFRIGEFRFLLNDDIRPALRLFQNRGLPGFLAWQHMIGWLPGLGD